MFSIKLCAALAMLLVAVVAGGHHAHHSGCAHDKVKMKNVPAVPQAYHGASTTREFAALSADTSAYRNMRTRYYFDVDGKGTCKKVGDSVSTFQGAQVTCTDVDVATPSKLAYWHRIMREAVVYFSNALKVVPIASPGLVPPAKCGDELATNGTVADTDFIIYVTAAPADSAGTLAWAYSCASDSNGRSIAAHVNIAPRHYPESTAQKFTLDRATFIHEIAHGLGFTGPFFENGYVDMSWVRQTGGSKTAMDSKLGKTTTKLTTPRVLKWARDYFACQSLDGVEVEDQGGPGTAGSHWEKRVLSEEYMVGVETLPVAYMSGLTLAFFEDLGNFRANYSWAEDKDMAWGRNAGCDFVKEKCNVNSAGTNKHFCVRNPTATFACTVGRTAIGSCDVQTYEQQSDLPAAFRYFSNEPLKGGSTATLDFCPIIDGPKEGVCLDASNGNVTNLGMTFARNSRCFTSTVIKTGSNAQSASGSSRCHQYRCTGNGQLIIVVSGIEVECPADGTSATKSVAGYNGVVTCPVSSELCGALKTTPTTAKPAATTAKPAVTTAKPAASTAKPTAKPSQKPPSPPPAPEARKIDFRLGTRLPACPKSNANPTACLCTTGCGVNGEAANPNGFAYKSPVWPPREEAADYVGADTICARVTVPTRPTLLGKALAAWLGLGGNVFNNGTLLETSPALGQEMTVYTAFTQRQCQQFQELASAVALNDDSNRPSTMPSVRIELCTGSKCNKPAPYWPATKNLVLGETKFPGKCPTANPSKTGCRCTHGCAWNNEAGGFPWLEPSWPPIRYSRDFVGADTVCARITLPVWPANPKFVALAAALGVTGNIDKDDTTEDITNVYGGQEVTVYTAFTAAQCAEFQTMAGELATSNAAARNVGIFLCNTEDCNKVGANGVYKMGGK